MAFAPGGMPGLAGAPSAAAAAGAAAAALLQRQLAEGGGPGGPPSTGWTEHQTGDGRKFYFHDATSSSMWEKPDVLMTEAERAVMEQTQWREYKIWDGRVFYHNKETKVSCWSAPPDVRKVRGESSGIDDLPLPLTSAEKRRAFWDLMKQKGVDETWDWKKADDATRDEPQAYALPENLRQQCFAELLSFSLRMSDIEAREKQRNAANALERLIEERFGEPDDVGTLYEDAKAQLEGEEAWEQIKSDIRRDEVFQNVMQRLEKKHDKARQEVRAEHVLRLQRIIGSDPELRRMRLRWKDAKEVLARLDELDKEDPPLEALRVWSSLRDLRPASEREALMKPPDADAYRAERKRREAFTACLQENAGKGLLFRETPWQQFEGWIEGDARYTALRDGPGATAQELFDEFQETLIPGAGPAATVTAGGVVIPRFPVKEEIEERPVKRRRHGFDNDPRVNVGEVPFHGKKEEPHAEEDAPFPGKEEEEDMDPLTAAAMGAKAEPADEEEVDPLTAAAQMAKKEPAAAQTTEDDDEMDPLTAAAAAAQVRQVAKAELPDEEEMDPLTAAATAAQGVAQGVAASTTPPDAPPGDDDDTEPEDNAPPPAAPAKPATGLLGAVGAAISRAVGAPAPKLSAAELEKKKVEELRALCKQKGLPVSGRKQDLIDRLISKP
eukprot:gnl/TRDRNA2_/TRDRNA2_187702_c0_seq1.p1 gnl/TRDRNA2_/TRDRNA2_187702_c0~~gnl/TRDRNA2_/TRDRNA2_187702_c0_seq1.p1  ORF type:complete len:690 (+),score=184.49 gnl/TRDRNA2_/TRDRNA2_187702_c0_seq1:66-2072(+)